ncbi:MAG: hypothetical protein R6V53_00320 [Candidatus Woesearchaeota archaeon]
MLQLYDNLNVDISSSELIEKIQKKDPPSFVNYKPPFPSINRKAFRYRPYTNLIIIGYGGSSSSFYAMYKALYQGKKNVEFINTVDPDELDRVKQRCRRDDTIVIAISKSGNTAGVLQALFYFDHYPMFIITSENEGALMNIVNRRGVDYIAHPEIGGRFSARTPSGFFPASILNLDIEGIDYGFRNIYSLCNEKVPLQNNPALHLALACHTLEKEGYSEIYFPMYSPFLDGFGRLITQLMHESVAKKGRGQTVITASAPEAQHHTNQRLFGGAKNMIALFLRVENYERDMRVLVPPDLAIVNYKDTRLSTLEGLPYSMAMHFELMGTYQNAVNEGIPAALISIERIDALNIGELIGFFQYFAVYSAYLREVNPFDQPHVEQSKNMTFHYIKEYNKNQ